VRPISHRCAAVLRTLPYALTSAECGHSSPAARAIVAAPSIGSGAHLPTLPVFGLLLTSPVKGAVTARGFAPRVRLIFSEKHTFTPSVAATDQPALFQINGARAPLCVAGAL
jgi:hypothetical protein